MSILSNFLIIIGICIVLLVVANKMPLPSVLKKLINITIAMVVIIYIFQYLTLIPVLLPMLH